MLPKISIVTPTYNSARYLEATIKSVVDQGYSNLEYIIVDGGSTDNTIEIIKKYDKYITWWISEPDNGMYDAINKGFEKSTGEIMAWLNSDDMYHPGALNIVSQIFSEIKVVDWIIGTPSLYNKSGECVKIFPNTRWSKSRFSVGDFKWIQQENVFWRRSLWEKVDTHIESSYKYAGDFELWCRFYKYSELCSVQTSLAGFRFHGDQLSLNNSSDYNNEVNDIFKLNESTFKKRFLLNLVWKIYTKCDGNRFFIIRNLKAIMLIVYNKMINYPPVIFYDFNKNKWIK